MHTGHDNIAGADLFSHLTMAAGGCRADHRSRCSRWEPPSTRDRRPAFPPFPQLMAFAQDRCCQLVNTPAGCTRGAAGAIHYRRLGRSDAAIRNLAILTSSAAGQPSAGRALTPYRQAVLVFGRRCWPARCQVDLHVAARDGRAAYQRKHSHNRALATATDKKMTVAYTDGPVMCGRPRASLACCRLPGTLPLQTTGCYDTGAATRTPIMTAA